MASVVVAVMSMSMSMVVVVTERMLVCTLVVVVVEVERTRRERWWWWWSLVLDKSRGERFAPSCRGRRHSRRSFPLFASRPFSRGARGNAVSHDRSSSTFDQYARSDVILYKHLADRKNFQNFGTVPNSAAPRLTSLLSRRPSSSCPPLVSCGSPQAPLAVFSAPT